MNTCLISEYLIRYVAKIDSNSYEVELYSYSNTKAAPNRIK